VKNAFNKRNTALVNSGLIIFFEHFKFTQWSNAIIW